MKEFFVYFFGQGTETEFSLFTLAHLAPIALMLLVIFLMHRFRRQLRRCRREQLIRYSVIVVSSAPLLIAYPFLQKYFDKGVMIGSVKG